MFVPSTESRAHSADGERPQVASAAALGVRHRFDPRRRLNFQARSDAQRAEYQVAQDRWTKVRGALAVARSEFEKVHADARRVIGSRTEVMAACARADRQLAEAQIAFEHADATRDRIVTRNKVCAANLQAVEDFLKGELLYGEPVKLGIGVAAKSEADLVRQLERVRADLASTIESARSIEKARIPEAEALSRLDRVIEEESRKVRTATAARFTAPGPFQGGLGLEALNIEINLGAVRPSIEPALAALFPDVIRERFKAWIREHLRDHAPGLPFAERGPELAKLADRRDELERREEAICRLAEREGWLGIDRRGDVRGELLVVWDDDAPQIAA